MEDFSAEMPSSEDTFSKQTHYCELVLYKIWIIIIRGQNKAEKKLQGLQEGTIKTNELMSLLVLKDS